MNYNRLQIANKIARKRFKWYHDKYPEDVKHPETYIPSVEGVLGFYRKTQKGISRRYDNPRRCGELTPQERKSLEAHII